ncbi:MAG: pyrroloquinoline quinone biosynthesis protein PqqB [Pseudomonadota bacterium]|nr:pyrroloquinoline quinone biosynthesis protein PqqB [Pseudomonadota bacterium]
MYVVALGAAAGGGFPQWNSNSQSCNRARAGDPAAQPRIQAGLAVSGDRKRWFLLNASPDLRSQIGGSVFLNPRGAVRSSPIQGVVLTGGDVDVIAGLLTLRERQPLTVFATGAIQDVLAANPIFEVLARDVVRRAVVPLDTPVKLDDSLAVELFAVPGKMPLYLESDANPPIATGDLTVGAAVSDGRRTLFYIPGCAAMTPALAARLRDADLVFFDATLWSDDEMIQQGLGTKTGRRMGHMSVSGPDGTIASFKDLGVKRKVLIHLNNSNPVLLEDSSERAEAVAAGWEVAYDGMEIVL